MNITLNDKVAIITGASSGIGSEIAVLFSKLGASLILHGRNEAGLDETIKRCGESARTKIVKVLGEFKDSKVLKNIVETALKSFGKIDILINNVGIFLGNDNIENLNMEDFDEIIHINLRCTVELTHLCVEHLVREKGNIVNISSICGTRAFTNLLSYEISKAAIDQFTRCISLELASKGVRVNSVNPGEVPTKMQRRGGYNDDDKYYKETASMHPLGRNGTTDDVAKSVAFLVSKEATFITGEFINVSGGLQNVCASGVFTNAN